MLGGVFFLPGYGMKFGFGRAGAQGANADAVRLHFLRKAFGEEQVKGFCGRVDGNIRTAWKEAVEARIRTSPERRWTMPGR